jgi:hypothetical protein
MFLFINNAKQVQMTTQQYIQCEHLTFLKLKRQEFEAGYSFPCDDRRSVGQSILVSSTHLGLMTRYLLLRHLRVC